MPRLFEENGFVSADGIVLSLSEFRLFSDLPEGNSIAERYKEGIIAYAESLIGKEYPHILATDYMNFTRIGDSVLYSRKMFDRRNDLVALINAENAENKGRFMDSICNLLWITLEESTWVYNSHNWTGYALSNEYDDNVVGLDLYAALTGAVLAYAYYTLKDKLDAITPVFTQRIIMMLRRRVITPFLNAAKHIKPNFWVGTREQHPNNWNPWICSNALFVTALVEDDLAVREKVVTTSLEYMDNFVAGYAPDGGCDEGPAYWGHAGASYLDCLETIVDMTGGKINIYHEPVIRKMVEYIANIYVAKDYYLNFADGSPHVDYYREMLATFAKDVGSEMLYTYAGTQKPWPPFVRAWPVWHVYRGYRVLCTPEIPESKMKAPLKVYFPDLQVAITRESEAPEIGLYIALKGGSNGESHNHNDVGTITVYSDGEPMFIDVGVGTYTRTTFSPQRYTIWSMNSTYHNTLNFGGTKQQPGRQYHAEIISYDEASGKMALDLSKAYPKEAGVISYTRSACLENGVITLRDTYKLSEAKEAVFSFMVLGEPENVSDGCFVYMGRKVKFDPSLSYSVEQVPCDTTETANLPRSWRSDKIYRILLTAPVSDSGDYTLTVE